MRKFPIAAKLEPSIENLKNDLAETGNSMKEKLSGIAGEQNSSSYHRLVFNAGEKGKNHA
jgi:hypothetical protein